MSRCLCNGVDGLITNEVTRCAAVIGRFDDAGVWDVASWLLDLLLRLASLFLPDPRVSYAIQVQAPPAATRAR